MEAIISFDPDTDAYDAIVAMVRAAYGLDASDPEPAATDTPRGAEPTDGPWNVKRATRYLRQLQPTALNAVAVVTAYGSIDRQRTAELVDADLRGHLSSLGYAARNTPGVPSGARPFHRQGPHYVMPDGHREVFVAAFLRAGQPISGVLDTVIQQAGADGEYARQLIEHYAGLM